MRSPSPLLTLAFTAFAAAANAQDRLSLADAVTRALTQNPAIRASDAAVGEASERVTQARSGYLPKLDLVGSVQRGDQPVFAFSSLLGARQFTAANFAIDSLNYPAPVTYYHTGIALEQPLFDGFRNRSATRAAELGRTIAETDRGRTREDLAVAVTQAYGKVLFTEAGRRAADAAVKAAEEDVARAERRRDAGMVTEADVLALRVHLARMRERQISTASDETIARAELNQAMGDPLDRQYALDEVATAAAPLPPVERLEEEALSLRPELRAAKLQEALAHENRTAAKGAFLPQVSLQGYVELNRTPGAPRASAWLFGGQMRWPIFQGLADVGRLHEAGQATLRAAAERERAESVVRLDVRTASARVQSATARQAVGQAVTAQALESQRIIRDRYEAGLSSVNDVLRAANAVLDAESQRIGALVDLLVSQAMLERAVGRVPAEK
jgi:outer membrane protein